MVMISQSFLKTVGLHGVRATLFTTLTASWLALSVVDAQVSYTGGTYTQNFDSLPSAGSFSLSGNGPFGLDASPMSASGLQGWSIFKAAGSGANALFNIGDGSNNQGAAYSFGTTGNSDRALGTLLSGATQTSFGLVLVNNSGSVITQFTLGYTGEQWRKGGSTTQDRLKFEYAVGATSIGAGTFTAVTALDFAGPIFTATGAALDGNASSNRAVVGGTVSGLNWQPGQNLVIRWVDLDISGSDCGLAIDDLSFSTEHGGGPVTPVVASTVPTAGATQVGVSAPISISFNTAVTVTGDWFTLVGSISGPVTATVSGGPSSYTLTPTAALSYNETVTVQVLASFVSDQSTGELHPAADTTFTFTTAGPPGSATPIHAIQGSGAASPLVNQTVTASGIVTGFYLNSDGTRAGFYLQQPDASVDADPDTSEGIYVYANGSTTVSPTLATLSKGDTVTVSGTVREFNTLTELDTLTALSKTGTAPLPAPVTVTLPFASATSLEKFEGMLVKLPQTLSVTNNFVLGRYGEFDVSSGGVLMQPTNVVAPGAPALARQAENNLNKLTVDDGTSKENPETTPYLYGGVDAASGTLRTGDTVSGLTGVITYLSATSYLLQPTEAPVFERANPRVDPPAVGGSLKVVGANVLNYFNGNGTGGGFPTSRGADTAAEFVRQRQHLIAAMLKLDADIYGLTEMENDGFGPTSAIQDLVNGLNAGAPAGVTYAFSNPGVSPIGTDEITCAFIYKTQTVSPVGAAVVNTDALFNRPPLAQTFRQISTNEKLTICVNHFKSKGSAPSSGVDTDQGDGQSAWNNRRTLQANALSAWLATNPTGDPDPDRLILGDLNAYSKEDPITALRNAGYANLVEKYEGPNGYSYQFGAQFGHLDHALASPALATQVTGAESWHNNADEPVYLDYNTEYKSAGSQAINDGPTPWRASDHDPVVVGISLGGLGQWIAGFPAVGNKTGFLDDFDRDGLVNALENFFGSNPAVPNAGLTAVSSTPGSVVFRHERRNPPATDLIASYEWSTNLVDWSASGESFGDATVTISPSVAVDRAAPDNDSVEVAAHVTSGTVSNLFLRVKVRQR